MSKLKTDLSIGSIHESNNYGLFKIIGKEPKDNKHMLYLIEFINTGFQNKVYSDQISHGSVRDYSINPSTDLSIGSIHESNNFGKFEIIGIEGKAKNGSVLRRIKFIDTGYETVVQPGAIRYGIVKDLYFKNVCGVAYILMNIHRAMSYMKENMCVGLI